MIILDIRWLIARGLYGEGNPCALLAVDVDDEHNAAQMQHKQRVWEFLRWISPAPHRRWPRVAHVRAVYFRRVCSTDVAFLFLSLPKCCAPPFVPSCDRQPHSAHADLSRPCC